MADRTTLRVLYKDTAGKSSGYNIGYCNPNATDSQLKALGMKLNALTTNTFVGVQKTEITNISDAVVYEYEVTAESTDVSATQGNTTTIALESDIPTSITPTWDIQKTATNLFVTVNRVTDSTNFNILFSPNNVLDSGTYTVTVTPKSGDTQLAASITFNVTVG